VTQHLVKEGGVLGRLNFLLLFGGKVPPVLVHSQKRLPTESL
jgi:hypothetical protein